MYYKYNKGNNNPTNVKTIEKRRFEVVLPKQQNFVLFIFSTKSKIDSMSMLTAIVFGLTVIVHP